MLLCHVHTQRIHLVWCNRNQGDKATALEVECVSISRITASVPNPRQVFFFTLVSIEPEVDDPVVFDEKLSKYLASNDAESHVIPLLYATLF